MWIAVADGIADRFLHYGDFGYENGVWVFLIGAGLLWGITSFMKDVAYRGMVRLFYLPLYFLVTMFMYGGRHGL